MQHRYTSILQIVRVVQSHNIISEIYSCGTTLPVPIPSFLKKFRNQQCFHGLCLTWCTIVSKEIISYFHQAVWIIYLLFKQDFCLIISIYKIIPLSNTVSQKKFILSPISFPVISLMYSTAVVVCVKSCWSVETFAILSNTF